MDSTYVSRAFFFVFIDFLGKKTLEFLESSSHFFIFISKVIRATLKIRVNFSLTVEQMSKIGITSLPLVILTSVFTGAVSSYQAVYQFSGYIPLSFLGIAVGKAIIVELGPVLTALVVAGRVGAAMAAELGTMRVTEQMDAMECLSLDPFRFLYAPRFFASTVMMPILVIIASFTGLVGASLVALFYDVNKETYFNGVKLFFVLKDVVIGLIKAMVFGAIIAVMGCYCGHTTRGGAEGVGTYTKKAVVASSVWILMADFAIVVIFL